eukprot:2738812-Lingulodinium_polyedra.AAC.1
MIVVVVVIAIAELRLGQLRLLAVAPARHPLRLGQPRLGQLRLPARMRALICPHATRTPPSVSPVCRHA